MSSRARGWSLREELANGHLRLCSTMCVYIYIYYVCMYVYMYIYIYIYIYILYIIDGNISYYRCTEQSINILQQVTRNNYRVVYVRHTRIVVVYVSLSYTYDSSQQLPIVRLLPYTPKEASTSMLLAGRRRPAPPFVRSNSLSLSLYIYMYMYIYIYIYMYIHI